MAGVLAHKRAVVAGMVDLNWNNLHGALGDRFIIGEARFIAPRTVEVTPVGGGPVRYLAGDKLFLNLGAKPAMPSTPGLLEVNPLTSQSALELDRLPGHLLILGGGYIGVELGQAFRRFGSRVTIVQRGSHLLPTEDADVSEAIESIFREDGIDVVLNAEVLSAEGQSGQSVRLHLKSSDGERVLEGSDLLVAVGRNANDPQHRTRRSRRRTGRERFHSRQRSTRNHRAQYLGARRLRRQPAADARLARRLSDRQNQRIRCRRKEHV